MNSGHTYIVEKQYESSSDTSSLEREIDRRGGKSGGSYYCVIQR